MLRSYTAAASMLRITAPLGNAQNMHRDPFPEGSHRSGARSGQPSSGSCATTTSARRPTQRKKEA
jgi:hypothetical protein